MELNGQAQLIHMFIHWNQMFTLLGFNLTVGHGKYNTQLFYKFLSHISGCLLQHIYKDLFS